MSNRLFRSNSSHSKSVVSSTPQTRLRVPTERAVLHCVVFDQGERVPGPHNFRSALQEVRERNADHVDDETAPPKVPDAFVWLDMSSPDGYQMEDIARAFDIHQLTVEDMVTAHQRPKLERFEDEKVFFVIRPVVYQAHGSVMDINEIIQTEELQILLAKDFIITIRHGNLHALDKLAEHMFGRKELLALGPSGVLWAMTDVIVDDYLAIGGHLEDDVDEMENAIFAPGQSIQIENVYMLKREIIEMRHAIDPLSTALKTLISTNKDLVPKTVRSYFRDVLDHQLLAADKVGSFDERLTSLITAAAAKISMQQNTDMRTISAYAAILAIPTAIAGIYGMNFENMPELTWKYGYFGVLGVMLGVIGILVWFFRKNDWL